MSNLFSGQRTVTAAATAVSLDSLIRGAPGANQPAAYTGSPIGVALNFSASVDLYVGVDSTVTNTSGGFLLPAGVSWTDYAIGQFGNAIDLTQFYVYAPA